MSHLIGLGSYAFLWQHSQRATRPLTLDEELAQTAAAGCARYQICDDPRLPHDEQGLRALRAEADRHGVELELGTRGVATEHLERFVAAARILGARVLRSMLTSGDDRPTIAQAELRIRPLLPQLEDAGVDLALETYEQVATVDLVSLVEAIGHDRVGICLDPANVVARLEHPLDTIRRTAPYVKSLHVKDFAFTRSDGWVGFHFTGARMGEGMLDLDALLAAVDTTRVAAIVEHWLPWQGDAATTEREERAWTGATLDHLRKALA